MAGFFFSSEKWFTNDSSLPIAGFAYEQVNKSFINRNKMRLRTKTNNEGVKSPSLVFHELVDVCVSLKVKS